MAIAVITTFFIAVLVALVWATLDSGAAAVPSALSPQTRDQAARVPAPEYLIGSAAYVVYGEKCRSARKAVPHYRALTWHRQQARAGELADRTPIVRGKTCRWARFTAEEWQARARSAQKALVRWQRSVGRVIERLDRGLSGTPMAGTGAILERQGREYGISPYFMAAVAATESSLGAAACSNNRFNVWGLSSCGSGWYVPAFRSWDEAIAFYARFLAGRWPSHSSPYSFSGYAACDVCWGRKVSEWMGRLFGVSPRTGYP